MQGQDFREERGNMIAQKENQIKRMDDLAYKVHSQSGDLEYDIRATESGWICNCPDYKFRGVKCKHIWAVEFSIKIRERVKENIVIEPINVSECLFCHSPNIKKFGVRYNKNIEIQRFLCADCQKTFSINIGFEKMKHNPQTITSAMQLYFTGESLRSVQKFLRLQGVIVSHVAIYKWIRKYVQLMERYLDQMKPNVGETWRADELWIKVKGNMKYLFALMDDETRFWIAQEVADTKYKHDARNIFRKGKEATGKKPLTLITDGLPAYHDAYKKEFYTNYKPRTEHIRDIQLSGEIHNNKMERMNGEDEWRG